MFYFLFQQKVVPCLRRSAEVRPPARRKDRKSVYHGLYTSSTTSALSPILLAYTAASGKPRRRENLDVDPAAAPGYREMGRSWTTLWDVGNMDWSPFL